MNRLAVSLLFAISMVGCSEPNLTLDNAREIPVSFEIDGKAYSLEGGGRRQLKSSPGNHKVLIKGDSGQVLLDTVIKLREAGVLHAGGAPYLLWKRLYGLDNGKVLKALQIELFERKYSGDFLLYPAKPGYIERRWDYDLTEQFPEEISLYSTTDYKVKSKLFRAREFVDYYEELIQNAK